MAGGEEETEEATAACNCLSSGETPPLLFTLFASLCCVPLYFYTFYAGKLFFFMCTLFLGPCLDAASFSFGLFGSSLPPSICSTPPGYIFGVSFTSFLLFCKGAEGAKAPLPPSKRISGEL